MPFGGVRGSGFGRFAGPAALEEIRELRWFTVGGPEGRHDPDRFLGQAPPGAAAAVADSLTALAARS
jgi:hypothetical protein